VTPVRYKLGFHIAEDDILHSYRLKTSIFRFTELVLTLLASVGRQFYPVHTTAPHSTSSSSLLMCLILRPRSSHFSSGSPTETVQFCRLYSCFRPPLWSDGQSSWLLTQRFRVRFQALLDFLSSSGSGTGSTQPL
jgi:hypothetical protein